MPRVVGGHGPEHGRDSARLGHGRHPVDELIAVPPLPNEGGALDAPHHDVLRDAGRMEAWPPWHMDTTQSRR